MKNLAQTTSGAARSQQHFNPFAKALAETERESFDQIPTSSNPFSDALSKTGNSLSNALETPQNQPGLLEEQKKQLLAEQENQLLRKKLHDKINPVDKTEVFIQEELKTKKALEQLRQELVFLVEDIKQFRKELAIATQQRVVSPGRTGTYHYSFFHQLRDFVIVLRQQINSARTWLHTTNGKNAKVAKRQGLDFTGNEQKSVHDSMHHERKMAFAGG